MSCGRALAEGVRFCDGCGANLSDRPVNAGPGSAAAASAPISRQLKEEVRARSVDAWKGLKKFARSPVGGLADSFAMFDDQRAKQVGIAFAILYEAAVLLGVYLITSKASETIGMYLPVRDLSAKQLLKVILLGLVPFASLIGAASIARAVFHGTGKLSGDVYTAGACLLPFGCFALAASLLGLANIGVIAVLFVFALTYTVLMLYAGCSRIGGISEAGAAPAVPIMLLLSSWLTKVIVVAVW
jgi:hypothetical protein